MQILIVCYIYKQWWCDQGKWVLGRALSNFRFVVYLVKQPKSFCFAENLIKSRLPVPQIYRQFCPAENSKIQKEFHIIIACISKSIFPTYDSFRLIMLIHKSIKVFAYYYVPIPFHKPIEHTQKKTDILELRIENPTQSTNDHRSLLTPPGPPLVVPTSMCQEHVPYLVIGLFPPLPLTYGTSFLLLQKALKTCPHLRDP